MTKILITGATDGIGLETSLLLAREGCELILHGRSAQKLAAAKEQVDGVSGNTASEICLADFSSLDEVARMGREIALRHDRLDVLINNAGVFEAAETVTEDGLDLRFVVNVFAPALLTRELLPLLGKTGRVINLSSAAQSPVDLALMRGERRAGDAMSTYAQSKLALTGWAMAMAETHPDGPSFVAVNPGSLLGSKMVKEGFGVAGNDLSIGAKILARASLAGEFAYPEGRYFDNDAGTWGAPHPAVRDSVRRAEIVKLIDNVIAAG